MGGRSTYGRCDFALSWRVTEGQAGGTDLDGLCIVLAGAYDDDEAGQPWRVALYIDERADEAQHAALADIFLGRAGGGTLHNFAKAIGEVYAVRRARIALDHTPGRQAITAEQYVEVRGPVPVDAEGPVTCGISGHDRPGTELVNDLLRVSDGPLTWEVRGRCGFATDFAYASDDTSNT